MEQSSHNKIEELYQLIAGTGYVATDADLQASGMTKAQAQALRNQYLRKNGLLPSQNKPVYIYVEKEKEERQSSSGGSVAKGKTQK